MSTAHQQQWQDKHAQLLALLQRLQQEAGIAQTLAQPASVQTARDCYFSIADPSLRKAAIRAACELQVHDTQAHTAHAADTREALAEAELAASTPRWIIPSLITCGAIITGYRIYPMIGDLCGLVVGYFASHAYIGYQKGKRLAEVVLLRGQLDRHEKGARQSAIGPLFSESECSSGAPD
jgi:hypothetical protein